jgi:hypothetical protein
VLADEPDNDCLASLTVWAHAYTGKLHPSSQHPVRFSGPQIFLVPGDWKVTISVLVCSLWCDIQFS